MKKCATIFVCVLFAIFFARITNAATAHCDFNGDGYDDLAADVPGEQGPFPPDPSEDDPLGAVSVIYGGANGLSSAGNQLFLGEGFFGETMACGDFNGDDVSDLAIYAPRGTANAGPAGVVTVFYGTKKSGLTTTGSQKWAEDTPGINVLGDFGFALAAGDFNGDGFQDLAMTVGNDDGGGVLIIYGSSTGLTADGNQFWNPSNLPDSEPFYQALVAADFGKNDASHCYDDLAIGAPDHSPQNAGAVHVLYGSASGLSTTGYQFWSEDSPGIPGSNPPSARFGSALAAGYFGNTDSSCGKKIADLVVGASGQKVGLSQFAGAVFTIYGTNSGLSATNAQMWTQNTSGIANFAESGDGFGSTLATGIKNSHGYLVIGVPNETTAGVQAGAIHILFTDATTGLLSAAGSKFIDQDTPGVKSSNASGGPFGFSLATGDFDGHGNDDVAVGTPFKTINGVEHTGAVHILYNANTVNTQFFHQNTGDMKDEDELLDRFGFALAQ